MIGHVPLAHEILDVQERRASLPRYRVRGRQCVIGEKRRAKLPGGEVVFLLFFVPDIYLPGGDNGPWGPYYLRGRMNSVTWSPEIQPLNPAAERQLKELVAKACGARYQYVSPYTGQLVYE